jgi:aubergine-like protein
MICGIDTYHDSAKKDSSVCAFIATMNETKTRFFSRATLQATHQELSNNLTLVVKSALQHFFKVNGGFPEKIIIYRDGVDDGKLLNVRDYEIPQIQKAFELTQADYRFDFNSKLKYIF